MLSAKPVPASTETESEVTRLVEHLFRHESGKMVATLARIVGFENLHVAEDAVQDALLKAMQNWAFNGLPHNPPAWLMQVAKNHALDVVRRERNFRSKEEDIAAFVEQDHAGPAGPQPPCFDDEIRDDQLRMMFACCHPVVPTEAQVALTLKTLCGFGEDEIAAAFLTSKAAIAKRLVRARQRLREAGVSLEIPAGNQLSPRLDAVLQTIYLL